MNGGFIDMLNQKVDKSSPRLLEGDEICPPYKEDLQNHFERIGYMLDPNHPDLMKLDPRYLVPPTESLKLYGYANQGNYGDVTGDRPGVFSIQDRMLWDAWAKYRGQSMDEAKVNFI